ncbi:unnamed protein product [Cuscuta campestris]|uniref:Uncharacterized protein n=1 Tax=Cuscuta campestris TaxID=132261 RepID=A0A484KV33_9ASTE|nr:unnamed protein product [Cuscuta campestris]
MDSIVFVFNLEKVSLHLSRLYLFLAFPDMYPISSFLTEEFLVENAKEAPGTPPNMHPVYLIFFFNFPFFIVFSSPTFFPKIPKSPFSHFNLHKRQNSDNSNSTSFFSVESTAAPAAPPLRRQSHPASSSAGSPTPPNRYDNCGVMVLAFLEYLLVGLPLSPDCSSEHMADFRCQFAARLWRGRKRTNI